ncbi:MAG TPA: DNA/RNA helicase domain-containing protein, partial [Chitinophagaceae bacterium]|nr:DNA/RNA helicase domain-containing protein [Chitinophagaceae bacterium]
TQPAARAKSDRSVLGYKKLLETQPEEGRERLRLIIKNTYRTLMTRGMKGCYVYFEDKELEGWFNNALK